MTDLVIYTSRRVLVYYLFPVHSARARSVFLVVVFSGFFFLLGGGVLWPETRARDFLFLSFCWGGRMLNIHRRRRRP